MKKVLITGAGGFIGFHLSKKLLNKNFEVLGIDNLNAYYSVKLKKDRLKILKKYKNFSFNKTDISNKKKIKIQFKKFKPDLVINLAAQAGVRYSLTNPDAYAETNLIGFFNILDCCRLHKISHFIYASTSSVYGANKKMPFKEKDIADHPIQFYAATKRSNEIMAHSYSSLYKIKTTGLRFFTVYGPWSRPDMSLLKFAKNISDNKKIDLFNYGNHTRDFTYVDDIVDGIFNILNKKIIKIKKNKKSYYTDPSSSPDGLFEVYNIGSQKPITLMKYVNLLEKYLGKKAKANKLPLQKGDILDTYSSTHKLKKDYNYLPKTKIENGIKEFVKWFKVYYKK
jgi:UDP-glucuronate 4-epimerase